MVLDVGSERPLGWCLHGLGVLLIVAPLLDLAAGVGSLNPGQVPWRFGAAGLLSGALVLPLLGFGLMLVATAILDQPRLSRLLGVKTAALVLVVLALLVVFGLDALQIRSQIRMDARRAFDLASLKAILTFGFETVVLAILSVSAFRIARAGSDRRAASRHRAPLVVPSRDP